MATATSDRDLVAASLDGDRRMFGVLIERHQPRARAIVRRLLADPFDAEDVTQEAILQAYLGLRELRDPDRFGSWLVGIALNLARMRMRRARSHGLDDVAAAEASEPPPEQAVEAAELLRLVQDAIDTLPPSQRQAVLMHYIVGLSCQEIGALVGLSTGAIRVRLHRARARLREQLAPTIRKRKEIEDMIEVEVEDVITRMLPGSGDGLPRLANERLRIVVLRERDGERVLPIWVGPDEGDALALQIAGEGMPRPLTVDLTARIVDATGARVERVTVSSLREKTFYGVVTLASGGGSTEIDARPSDALNLAARVGAPIYVDAAVLDEAGRPAGELPACLDQDEAEFLGPAGEGEWQSVSPELARALREPPKPAA